MHQCVVVCDGCGTTHQTQRDVAITPMGEIGFLHHPKGWTVNEIEPGVALVSAERPPPNPFGDPSELATSLGKPVRVLLCTLCTTKMARAQ